MRRSDLLTLTGLTVPVFNAWRRRQALPFPDPKDSGWGDYSIQNAIALDLAVSLDQLGLAQRTAGEFVRSKSDELFAALRSEGRNTAFGCMVFQDVATARDDEKSLQLLPFCCKFSELDTALSGQIPRPDFWPARRGLLLVDLSDRIDELFIRAQISSDPSGLTKQLEAVVA